MRRGIDAPPLPLQAAVSETNAFKLLEAGALLAALAAFVWWQLRDVKRAQEESRRRREAEQAGKKVPSGAAAPTAQNKP
jgi:hypothetical protein